MIFRNVYSQSQSDLTIITPSSGQKLYIWQVVIESEGTVTVEFLTSNKIVAELLAAGKMGVSNMDKLGEAGEVLSLTCAANTTITVLYDEVD